MSCTRCGASMGVVDYICGKCRQYYIRPQPSTAMTAYQPPPPVAPKPSTGDFLMGAYQTVLDTQKAKFASELEANMAQHALNQFAQVGLPPLLQWQPLQAATQSVPHQQQPHRRTLQWRAPGQPEPTWVEDRPYVDVSTKVKKRRNVLRKAARVDETLQKLLPAIERDLELIRLRTAIAEKEKELAVVKQEDGLGEYKPPIVNTQEDIASSTARPVQTEAADNDQPLSPNDNVVRVKVEDAPEEQFQPPGPEGPDVHSPK
ncbi:MAG: hypothetical protein Q9186_006116 [Xanthomendoza sp. 1 TL-2023]